MVFNMGIPPHAGNEGGACRCADAIDRGAGPDGRKDARPRAPKRLHRLVVARRKNPVPWPVPGPRQWATHAGRSPGSRVMAWCTPSQVAPVAGPDKSLDRCIALTAYSCRDSLGFGDPREDRLTAFPY